MIEAKAYIVDIISEGRKYTNIFRNQPDALSCVIREIQYSGNIEVNIRIANPPTYEKDKA